MVESNYFFYKKVHIKRQSNKENVLAIFVLLQEKKNSNLFQKKCTQENGPKTPGMTSKTTVFSVKGISSFAGDFVPI